MCVLSIKVPIRKKSGNLFNDSRRYNSKLLRTSRTLHKVILKWSLTAINSDFYFNCADYQTKVKELRLPYNLTIVGGRIIGFIPFQRVLLALWEMQIVLPRFELVSPCLFSTLITITLQTPPTTGFYRKLVTTIVLQKWYLYWAKLNKHWKMLTVLGRSWSELLLAI